jgi:hypothetical protein
MVWMISASIAYRGGDYDVHLVRIGHESFPVRVFQFSVEHSMTNSSMRTGTRPRPNSLMIGATFDSMNVRTL